jgi:hypothetical protein
MATPYLKNKDLYVEIIRSKDASTCTPELMDMFILISTKLSTKFDYKASIDREDCIWGGVEDAWKYFWSFDASKSTNAFAYITQIIKNGQSKQNRTLYDPYFKDIGYSQVSLTNIYSL